MSARGGWFVRALFIVLYVYTYLFVCLGAYVWTESMSARGGWMCALCLIHVYTCLCVCSCLSFSLRSPPPSPPLSLLVSFFKCKGVTNTVCVCVWMGCGDWKWPDAPQRAISVNTRREATIITFLPRKIFFGCVCKYTAGRITLVVKSMFRQNDFAEIFRVDR